MRNDVYEIHLLEIRQSLKEAERQLRNDTCVDMFVYRRVLQLKAAIKEELINNRIGISDKRVKVLNLLEG